MNAEKALKAMHKNRANFKEKGDYGEIAVMALLREYQDLRGGVIIHSYTYPYAMYPDNTPVPGNVKYINGKFEVFSKKGIEDEIDLMYVTPYRIFVIEVKARTGYWSFYDYWSKKGNDKVDKCPIAQSEKHCRHLYHTLWEYLPDGNPDYIVPIVVFVDKVTIRDARSSESKKYVTLSILNTFKSKLKDLDIPLDYGIDVEYFIANALKKGTGKRYG